MVRPLLKQFLAVLVVIMKTLKSLWLRGSLRTNNSVVVVVMMNIWVDVFRHELIHVECLFLLKGNWSNEPIVPLEDFFGSEIGGGIQLARALEIGVHLKVESLVLIFKLENPEFVQSCVVAPE